MTSTRLLSVLARAAREKLGFTGTSLNYEQQAGHLRQVGILLRRKLARMKGGRLVATVLGRKLLEENGWRLDPC